MDKAYLSIAYLAKPCKRLPPEGFKLAALPEAEENLEGGLEAHYSIQYRGQSIIIKA